MQLFALFLTFITLFFVLLSFLPVLGIPSMALIFGVFFLLIALILGLLSKCKFVWISNLLMLLACGLSLHLQLARIQDFLSNTCEKLIAEGNYQVSDYIVDHTRLGYLLRNSEGDKRIAQLKAEAQEVREKTRAACAEQEKEKN